MLLTEQQVERIRAKAKRRSDRTEVRRARYRAKMLSLQRCTICGDKLAEKSKYKNGSCVKCVLESRYRHRRKTNSKAWKQGGRGRPPLVPELQVK